MLVEIRFWSSKKKRDQNYRRNGDDLLDDPSGFGFKKAVYARTMTQIWAETMEEDPNLLSFTKIEESDGVDNNETDHVKRRETAVSWLQSK